MKNYILLLFAFAQIILGAGAQSPEQAVFGSEKAEGAALIGILYDLKQTQKRSPLPISNDGYWKIIDTFLASDWDEAVLNRHYRAGRCLYVTQVFIPNIQAAAGPAAFGVEGIVKPNYWLVHYKGQVAPPEEGTYRFVGYGDNVLNVAVNGKTVLVANRGNPLPHAEMSPAEGAWAPAKKGPAMPGRSRLRMGKWITLKAREIVDLDVVIGESSGKDSAFFLLIEKQGENYRLDEEGKRIFPIFQVAPFNTPPASTTGPDFSPGQPWKCIQ